MPAPNTPPNPAHVTTGADYFAARTSLKKMPHCSMKVRPANPIFRASPLAHMEPTESTPPRKPRLAPDETPPPPPETEAERVKYGFKRADVKPVNTNEHPPVDVYDILQTNLQTRATREKEKPITAPPMSRRTRDYLTLMILMNLVGGAAVYFSRHNLIVLAFAGSGLILLNLGLTWLCFVVMNRD